MKSSQYEWNAKAEGTVTLIQKQVLEKETPIQELNADWKKHAEAQKYFTQKKTVPGPLKDKQITLRKFQQYQ